METLIERISFLLEKAGNSVTTLASIAWVKPPSVSDWLNGKTKTLKSVPAIRLAKHFGVNVLWLTEGVGPRNSSEKEPASSPLEEITTEQLVIELVKRLVGQPEIEMRHALTTIELMVARASPPENKQANGGR